MYADCPGSSGAGPHANRNAPCPCGSGRKYKQCCLRSHTTPAPAAAPTCPGAAPADVASVAALVEAGTRHHQAGHLGPAERRYRDALEREPRHTAALFYLGRLLEQKGDLDESIAVLRRCHEVDPKRARTLSALASALMRNRKPEEAVGVAARAVALEPGDAFAHDMLAGCLARVRRIGEATAAAERAVALAPDDLRCAVTLGDIRRRQGRLEDARLIFERVLATPDLSESLLRPATHNLGVVCDRLGDYEAAYDAFSRFGRVSAESGKARCVDRTRLPRRIAAYREACTANLLRAAAATRHDDGLPAPAFLVGFPRSGTTMTEQILAAHPDVTTSDERPILAAVDRALVARCGADAAAPALLGRLAGEDVRALRRIYWNEARKQTGIEPGAGLFLDKLPLNIIDVGLVNMLFPDARVIVALRDPRDVCLSCIMQEFWINDAMIHFVALDSTVAFYVEVMGFWLEVRERLTVPWLEIRYEDTVADPATHARALLDFAGLAWDDRVLCAHERSRERYILTPSADAVAEPVHRRAVGRWHHYVAHLEPLLPQLAPFIEAFGYAT